MKTMIETLKTLPCNQGDIGIAVPDGTTCGKQYIGFRGAIELAVSMFESASTPRPPKAEWFGNPETEPGKWDAFWIEDVGVLRGCRCGWVGLNRTITGITEREEETTQLLKRLSACIPVARTGFPSPVGWSVVGG